MINMIKLSSIYYMNSVSDWEFACKTSFSIVEMSTFSWGFTCLLDSFFSQVNVLLDWSSSALLDYQWIIFRKISASQSDHQDLLRNVCFTFTVPQRRNDLPKPSKHLTSSEERLFLHLSISIALHYMFGSFQSHLTKTYYWRYRATTDI